MKKQTTGTYEKIEDRNIEKIDDRNIWGKTRQEHMENNNNGDRNI